MLLLLNRSFLELIDLPFSPPDVKAGMERELEGHEARQWSLVFNAQRNVF